MTNQEVADLIGLSMSGVSRLRTGSRAPNDETMHRVHQALGWDIHQQFTARLNGDYPDAFNRAIRRYADIVRRYADAT